MIELKVGSKGELFLPKSLRNRLNLQPGDKLYLDVSDDTIIIKKIPDLAELLRLPMISKKISVEEANDGIRKEMIHQMQFSKDDLSG